MSGGSGSIGSGGPHWRAAYYEKHIKPKKLAEAARKRMEAHHGEFFTHGPKYQTTGIMIEGGKSGKPNTSLPNTVKGNYEVPKGGKLAERVKQHLERFHPSSKRPKYPSAKPETSSDSKNPFMRDKPLPAIKKAKEEREESWIEEKAKAWVVVSNEI